VTAADREHILREDRDDRGQGLSGEAGELVGRREDEQQQQRRDRGGAELRAGAKQQPADPIGQEADEQQHRTTDQDRERREREKPQNRVDERHQHERHQAERDKRIHGDATEDPVEGRRHSDHKNNSPVKDADVSTRPVANNRMVVTP
jgi:hypothetical protein